MRLQKRHWISLAAIVVVGIAGGVWLLPKDLLNPKEASSKRAAFERIAQHHMSRLAVALDSFRADNGFYPTTEQGLDALIVAPRVPPVAKKFFTGGYINAMNAPKDPWGRPYIYKSPDGDRPYSIRSKGRLSWYAGDDLVYPTQVKQK